MRIWRGAGFGMVLALLAGCVVPDHMNVTAGLRPDNLDKHVRFRTTYYFRTFDYCWKTDAAFAGGRGYREIVPETDTLYRFRMTGKAPSLTNKIRFESGTLDADKIDPFGTEVRFDSDANGFVTRTMAETLAEGNRIRAAREAAAAKAPPGTADRVQALIALLGTVQASPVDATTKTAVIEWVGREVVKIVAPPQEPPKAEAPKTEAPKPDNNPPPASQEVKDLLTRVKTLKTDLELPQMLEVLTDIRNKLTPAPAPAKPDPHPDIANCKADKLDRGFQLMGPEGMKAFNQNSRLVMAMSSSAKPLIETLQEYSGRMLAGQTGQAEQLLPLTEASLKVANGQRSLLELRAATKPEDLTIDAVFGAAQLAAAPAKAGGKP